MENKRPVRHNSLVNRRPMKSPAIMKSPAMTTKAHIATTSTTTPINRTTTTTSTASRVAAVPIENKPLGNPVAAKPTVTSDPKKGGKKKKGDKKVLILGIIIVVVIALIVGIIVAVSLNNSPSDTNSPDSFDTPNVAAITEEEERITKETLEKYAEVTIDGYKKEEGHEISSDIVKVHVKNISEDQTSLHIVIVANDKDGNALDVSHLYAEGIRPGDVQDFDTFVYTTMTPEQMKNATYNVYTAATYKVNLPAEEAATGGGATDENIIEETVTEEIPSE